MNSTVMFSKASDEWTTPPALIRELEAEFHFTLDGAATPENAVCPRFYSDAVIEHPYQERIFVNPPYSRVRDFLLWTSRHREGNLWVYLLPSRTDTRWWHDYVWDTDRHCPRRGVEVRFIKGRLKFGIPATVQLGVLQEAHQNSAPFPSAIVIFRPRHD